MSFLFACLVGDVKAVGGEMLLWTRLSAVPSATLTSQQKTKTNIWMHEEIYLCSTHRQHTQAMDLFGGYVCWLAAVAKIVSWHKARPLREREDWVRMVALEQKGPVISLHHKMPQTYFGYNYLFDCRGEMVKYASTMHMIHDGIQQKGSIEL